MRRKRARFNMSHVNSTTCKMGNTFFVPNRLLWEIWEEFITGGPDGNNDSVPPTVSLTTTLERK